MSWTRELVVASLGLSTLVAVACAKDNPVWGLTGGGAVTSDGASSGGGMTTSSSTLGTETMTSASNTTPGTSEGSATTGGAEGSTGEALGMPTFSNPREVTELNDDGADDDDPTVRGDGLEIYFSSARDTSQGAQIVRSTRAEVGAMWSSPVPVGELNTMGGRESDPSLSPDGRTIVWASDALGQPDVYFATRVDWETPWEDPQLLPGASSMESDFAGRLVDGGRTMYLCSYRGTGNYQMFVGRRSTAQESFGTFDPMTVININESVCSPWVSAAQHILLIRADGTLGGTDIYVSMGDDGVFGQPVPVGGGVNSVEDDSDPWLVPVTRELFFSRGNGNTGQLWVADVTFQ